MHQPARCLSCQVSRFAVSQSTILPTLRPRASTLWLGSRIKCSHNLHLPAGEDCSSTHAEATIPSIGGVVVSANTQTGEGNSKPQWADDVNVNDLTATLEAHRATNRAVKVRKGRFKQRPSKKRLSIADKETEPDAEESNTGTTRDDGNHKSERQKSNWVKSHWPAHSSQVLTLTGQRYHAKAHKVLEYKACWLPPQGPFSIEESVPQRPYLALIADRGNTKAGGSLQRLHDELKAYEAYMQHSKIEEEASRILVSDVRGLIGKRYRHNPLLIVGSCSTGLADRLSDIDLALIFPNIVKEPLERGPSSLNIKNQKLLRSALQVSHTILNDSKLFEKAEQLLFARVPIVRAEHAATGLRIEIQTLFSSSVAQAYVASYLAEHPTLRTLYIVLRSALRIRNLANAHLGGLGSYPILIMIVNALKHASAKFASDDLASQFLHILEFYGNADLYKYGFSPDPPRQFLKRKEGRKMTAEEKARRLQDPMLHGIDIMKTYYKRKPYLLCLQDPADPTNDLGKNAYGIKHVQEMFRKFSQQLRDQMKTWDEGKDRSPYGLLGNLLEANYTELDYQRRKMRGWVIKRQPSLTAMLEKQFPPEQYRLRSQAKRAIKRDKHIMEGHLAAVPQKSEPASTLLHDLFQPKHQQEGKTAFPESEREELQAVEPATDHKEDISPPGTDADGPGLEEKPKQPKIELRS